MWILEPSVCLKCLKTRCPSGNPLFQQITSELCGLTLASPEIPLSASSAPFLP